MRFSKGKEAELPVELDLSEDGVRGGPAEGLNEQLVDH